MSAGVSVPDGTGAGWWAGDSGGGGRGLFFLIATPHGDGIFVPGRKIVDDLQPNEIQTSEPSKPKQGWLWLMFAMSMVLIYSGSSDLSDCFQKGYWSFDRTYEHYLHEGTEGFVTASGILAIGLLWFIWCMVIYFRRRKKC